MIMLRGQRFLSPIETMRKLHLNFPSQLSRLVVKGLPRTPTKIAGKYHYPEAGILRFLNNEK